jgi:K+-sensing histidine kinase KdpD
MIEKVRRPLAPWRSDWRESGGEGLPSRLPIPLAFACVAAAAIVHFVCAQFINDLAPSILYNTAIFCAALWGGIRAGLVAAGVSASLIWLAFNSRVFGNQIPALTQAISLTLFVSTAAFIVWIGQRYRSPGMPGPHQTNRRESAVGMSVRLHWLFRDGLAPNSLAAYIFAVACIAVATLIRSGFASSSGNIMPLVSYYPAILLSALVGGAAAGLSAIVFSLIAVWSEFPGPFFSVGLPTRDESVSLALYVFGSLFSVWLFERHRPDVLGARAQESRLLQLVSSVLVAFSAILLTSVVLLAVDSFLDAKSLVFVYLLPTVVIAIHYGSTLAVLTSFASGAAAAYFFFPPKFSFYIADPLNVAELGFFLLLAVIASKAVAAVTHDVRVRQPTSRR